MARKATTATKSETKTTLQGTSRAAAASARGSRQVPFEKIQARAYEIFRSGQAGGALEHWLQAERELRAA
jgi:hypothetical protein